MGQFWEYFKISLKSIWDNKMRSILTMFGIIIGIGSVIMIVSVGNGVRNSVSGSLNTAFGGQTYIMAGSLAGSVEWDAVFNEEDILAVKDRIPHVKTFSMEEQGYGTADSGKGEKTAWFTACTEDYEFSKTNKFVAGRYFTKEEYEAASPVCVLNENSAKVLFGHTDVVGQSFSFTGRTGNSRELTVVGVRGKSESEMYNLVYYEDEVEFEMPYSTFRQLEQIEEDDFIQVLFLCDSAKDAEDTVRSIITFLEGRKGIRGQHKITHISFSTYMDRIMQVVNYITIFISFVAAISLVVGGVGVMNIMLVSVTERTQEIGIRKALGARTSSIMVQFLAESAVLTGIGGILGIILGYLGGELLCFIVSKMAKISVVASVSVWIVIGVVLFSAAIGMFFGMYPAGKAAKLNPIDALRQE